MTRAGASGASAAAGLLTDILPGVSRSFALSLRVLPAPLRHPLGVTYLVARAADTIADTRALPPGTRLAALHALRRSLSDGDSALPSLAGVTAGGQTPAERTLLARLPDVLAAYRRLESGDRDRALGVLLTLDPGHGGGSGALPARDGRPDRRPRDAGRPGPLHAPQRGLRRRVLDRHAGGPPAAVPRVGSARHARARGALRPGTPVHQRAPGPSAGSQDRALLPAARGARRARSHAPGPAEPRLAPAGPPARSTR